MADLRDGLTWVAIELSRSGEMKAVDGTLEAQLRRDLDVDPDHPIFVPVALFRRDGRVTPIHLMEGYAFVASGLEDVAYFALEHLPYISAVMSTQSGRHRLRTLAVISDAQVQAMREKLREMITSEIPLSVYVMILDGPYRGLAGLVTGMDKDNAFIRITLRSLDVVATIPRIFLDERQEE